MVSHLMSPGEGAGPGGAIDYKVVKRDRVHITKGRRLIWAT
jgi:hypothetical protein